MILGIIRVFRDIFFFVQTSTIGVVFFLKILRNKGWQEIKNCSWGKPDLKMERWWLPRENSIMQFQRWEIPTMRNYKKFLQWEITTTRNWFHTIFQNLQHAILYSATNVSSALLVFFRPRSDLYITWPGRLTGSLFMFYEVECWYTIDFNSRDQIHWILTNTTRLMGFNTKNWEWS